MALVVVLPVAAPLSRAEPRHRGTLLRIVAAGRLEDGAGHGRPLGAVHRAGDAPVVRPEPGLRRAGHDARDRRIVDAKVVPVDEEHEVAESQAPRAVARFVARARRQAALALDHEDLDLVGTGELQGDGLARRWRHAVSGRSGVELQEERLALHLGVAGQAAAMAQAQEVLPRQCPAPVVRERELVARVTLVAGAHHLVQDRERAVDERHGVTGGKDEPIAERQPGPAEVPAHGPGEQQRQQQMDLRTRAARVPGLAVVERQVDRLVDDILHDLPVLERRRSALVERIDAILDDGHDAAPTSLPVRSSAPSESPMRSRAASRFSRELAYERRR